MNMNELNLQELYVINTNPYHTNGIIEDNRRYLLLVDITDTLDDGIFYYFCDPTADFYSMDAEIFCVSDFNKCEMIFEDDIDYLKNIYSELLDGRDVVDSLKDEIKKSQKENPEKWI